MSSWIDEPFLVTVIQVGMVIMAYLMLFNLIHRASLNLFLRCQHLGMTWKLRHYGLIFTDISALVLNYFFLSFLSLTPIFLTTEFVMSESPFQLAHLQWMAIAVALPVFYLSFLLLLQRRAKKFPINQTHNKCCDAMKGFVGHSMSLSFP